MQKIIIVSVVIAAMALLIVTKQFKGGPSTIDTPPIPVIAATPAIKDVTTYLESLGTLQPSVFMEVRPQADGMLTEVLVTEGQWVKEGTPLFKIDSKTYAIKVQEAEAQLAISRANLQAAQKKLDRFKELAEKDLLAKTEWDDLEATAARCHATIELDEARLNAANLNFERCTVCAPVEGRIGKLDTYPGRLVSSGKPLATIVNMNPLVVEFTVTEKEFPQIGSSPPLVELQSLCSSEAWHTAAVTFLDNHFDPKTGLLLVRGRVMNSDQALRPGQSVRVRMPIGVRSGAKLIPQKAIRYNPQGPYVYVVMPDHTVASRQILLGEEQGTDIMVLEGVDQKEQVIIDGHLRLSPGLKVEVKS